MAKQEGRLAVANAELGKAQALLDEKQAELDKVQAKFDAAMNEKMVRLNTQKLLIRRTEMLHKYVLCLEIQQMFTLKKYLPERPYSLAMSAYFGSSTLHILFFCF